MYKHRHIPKRTFTKRRPAKRSIDRLKKLLRSDEALMVAFKNRKGNAFITDVLRKAMVYELSYNQLSAVRNAGVSAAKFNAMKSIRAEAVKDAPVITEGKYEFTGTVVSKKLHSGRFGDAWKMIIESSSGNKLWGSVPNKLVDTINVGMKVKMIATVKLSDNDDHFGFYSRPSNVEVL